MKRYKTILATMLSAAVALASCDYTDLEPTDMVGPEKAFGTVENVHKAVVGIYGKVSLRSKLAITEYIADDCVQGSDSGGAGTDLTNWVYTATSGDVSGIWSHYYGIINQANRVLYYGPEVEPANESEEASLQESFGTAYFFRAYAHFELLCFFSDFMDDEAKGIPYVSHYHVVGNPSREPVGDCYEQIMTDLNRAYEMLSVEAPDLSADLTASNSTAYISRATVDALRARVALYHGLYSQAYIYATNALRAVPIAKKDEVQNVWLDKSNAGVIFQLSRPAGSATIGTLFVGGDYSSIFRPSSDLREQYAETDIRASVFLEYGRDRAGSPVWMVKKWFGDASDIGRVDEKMFRAEEMQLIAAEALARRENPDMTEANRLLNELRAQRHEEYTSQDYPSQSAFMTEIAKERRLELVWEGHRMFDARRLNLTMSREGKSITGDDYRLTLPIPQAEIDANSGISESDQNYGY